MIWRRNFDLQRKKIQINMEFTFSNFKFGDIQQSQDILRSQQDLF